MPNLFNIMGFGLDPVMRMSIFISSRSRPGFGLKNQRNSRKKKRKEREERRRGRSDMVAISLYRGNLHKAPDVPRQWLMPKPQISLKDFRLLLSKREKALSGIRPIVTITTIASTSNPNPNPNSDQPQGEEEVVGDNGCSKQTQPLPPPLPVQLDSTIDHTTDNNCFEETQSQLDTTAGDAKHHTKSDGDVCMEQAREIGDSDSTLDTKASVRQTDSAAKDVGAAPASEPLREGEQNVSPPPPIEISINIDLANDREKKKKDLEEKLHVLNETKHNLVQMLKQILNAEEEMKRRSSVQASVGRPPALQLEATIDLGSNPKHSATRTGPEAISCGDLEGESADVPHHNAQVRQFHQMRITSSSAPSSLRKPALSSLQHNAVPNTTRSSMGAGGNTQTTSSILTGVAASPSPSRFAPTGLQGHPTNPPSLSVSGTHFTASSPSPAASGGSSVFRDTRLTSPSWS